MTDAMNNSSCRDCGIRWNSTERSCPNTINGYHIWVKDDMNSLSMRGFLDAVKVREHIRLSINGQPTDRFTYELTCDGYCSGSRCDNYIEMDTPESCAKAAAADGWHCESDGSIYCQAYNEHSKVCKTCGTKYVRGDCPYCCVCQSWVGNDRTQARHHPTCDGTGQRGQSVITSVTVAPSLSLLVIDLGDICCVRVETGEWYFNNLYRNNTTGTYVYDRPFDQLKAALESAPVPRIERRDDDKYSLIEDEGIPVEHICKRSVAVIETVIGRPLRIWEGGKWEQLWPAPEPSFAFQQKYCMTDAVRDFKMLAPELPFKAWRYTR